MAKPTPDQLTAAYMARAAAIRKRVETFAVTLWGSSAALRDRDVEALVTRIVPVVQGGQVQVANLTNAYIASLAVLEGVAPPDLEVDRDSVVTYRGVDPTEVYRRPAVETYSALSSGASFSDARARGVHRLRSIVGTDLQQTRNRQSAAGYASSGFDYTLRVLSGAENCALCVIASTQRYNASDLQPMHPGCDCGERGVRADRDPGQVIQPHLLELTYSQIDAKLTSGDLLPELGNKVTSKGKPISDYTDLIIAREHGELGPTLTWRQDRFTGPDDLH